MALSDLYCLAAAPLLSTCLDSPSPEDVTIEVIVKELHMLLDFSGCGFKNFIDFFEARTAKNETKEFTAALACLSGFCARLQDLVLAASNVARTLQGQFQPCSSQILKEYETKSKKEGLTPSDKMIGNLLDTDTDAEWNTHAIRRGKVEFTHVAKGAREVSGGAAGIRKQGRKATGYVKYNAPTDHEDSSDDDHPATTPTNKKASKPNTPQAADSGLEKTSTSAVQRQKFLTLGSLWPLWDCCKGSGTELSVTEDETALGSETDAIRRESSVHISTIQEINDDKGDRTWNELPRRIQRFDRIRKRVPTGHPKLLKDSSEEALGALAADDMEGHSESNERLMQQSAETSAELPDPTSLPPERVPAALTHFLPKRASALSSRHTKI